MVNIRTLIPLAILSTFGCTAAQRSSQSPLTDLTNSVQKVFEPEKPPEPATEFACAWANRLQQLPDNTRNGQMTAGIVGQVFLFHANMQPAAPIGELTVSVSDATPRAPGTPPRQEVWHYTAKTLKKMVVMDERYGRSLAVFLPWPPEWNDVSKLNVQARYDQPDGTTLFAQPTTLTLDFTLSGGASAGGVVPGQLNPLSAVPDPRVAIRQMQQSAGMPQSPVVSAGWNTPNMPAAPQYPANVQQNPTAPAPQYPASAAPQPLVTPPNPQQQGEFRAVIPR